MTHESVFDVTIVGGGPAGLYSAFYSGLREMKTKIIEFHPFLGGKVHVYPEKMVWDIGGLTPVSGAQLIDQMVTQGTTFDPEVVLGEKVVSLNRDENNLFVLRTASGQEHYSRTVILAIGSGIVKPIKLDVEGAEKFEVSNLHYTVKSLKRFKNKTVLISGGGNSAIDWANELEPIAAKVYLTYRKDMPKGHESQIKKMLDSTVEYLPHTIIDKLIAADNHQTIEKVRLKKLDKGELSELAVDEVVVNHGFEKDRELLNNSELAIDLKDDWWIAGSPMSETSIEGLYAAGDVLHHEGKLHLIAGAFQDAANAVNKAKQFISPDAHASGMVSSHNELFIEKNRELLKHLYVK